MNLMDWILTARLAQSGFSGSSSATAAGAVGGQIVNVSGTTPSIAAADNNLYLCGELTSLTISSFPASGLFELVFQSGSTATQVTLPGNVLLPDGVTIEADTIYDLSVRVCTVGETTYGLATIQCWSVPAAAE